MRSVRAAVASGVVLLGTTLGAVAVPGAAVAGAAPTAAAPAASPYESGQWWVDQARLRERHAAGQTGAGVTIALVNGPITPDVPELRGQDVRPSGTLCTADDDSAGGPVSQTVPLGDASFHTTSVAALLVGNGRGNGPGGEGVLGVAPGATLRVYSLFNDPTDDDLMCRGAKAETLVDKAVSDGADVIVMPQSLPAYPRILAAFNRAMVRGIPVVVGAGNGGATTRPLDPGNSPGFLVVGSIGPSLRVSTFSPASVTTRYEDAPEAVRGGNVILVAPGEQILGGSHVGSTWSSVGLQQGTSASSTIVAGLLALMKQRWPTATGNQLVYSLVRSASTGDPAARWTPRTGYGTPSFEKSLTTDPRAFPDIQPLFGSLAKVMSSDTTPSDIPTTEAEVTASGDLAGENVPGDGTTPAPAGTLPSGSASGSASASPAGGAPSAVASPSPGPVALPVTPSGGPGAGWWAGGGVVLVVAAGGVLLLRSRNRRRRIDVNPEV